MAIAVNGTRLASGATNVLGNPTPTLGATPTLGSTLLISLATSSQTTTVTSADDLRGNTWVQVFDSGNTSTGVRTFLWICKSQRGLVSGDTVRIITGQAPFCYAIDEVTGLGSNHAPDATKAAFDNTNVSAFSTGASSTTAYTDELVWAVIATPVGSGTTQGMTAGTGYTQQGSRIANGSGAVSMYTEYKIVAATGAQTADGTFTTTASKYQAELATFPDPQSPESAQRATAHASVVVSAVVGTQRGVSFIGVEVSMVSGAPPPPSTKRRPSIIVA